MSMTKLVFPGLCWGELAQILSYLSIRELWKLGHSNRSAFITFLREKSLRHIPENLLTSTRFLSKYAGQERVLLASYPRSGNSFMRKLLEIETGIVTGSDSRPNRTLSASLLQCGYKGEGVTDDSVWIVKSHYPERLGYIKFDATRVVLLVRNPFDAIESYFHMGMTNTHDKTLNSESFQSLQAEWHECVLNEAAIWTAFHAFWLRQAVLLPVLLVRYEDLLNNQKDVMREMSAFLREGAPPVGLNRYSASPPTKKVSRCSGSSCGSSSSGNGSDSGGVCSPSPLDTVFTGLNTQNVSQSSGVYNNNIVDTSANTTTATSDSLESVRPSSAAPSSSGPTGYAPKKKKMGKALQVMSVEDVFAVVRSTNQLLKDFGYDLAANADQSESQYSLKLTPMLGHHGRQVFSRRLDATSSQSMHGDPSKHDAADGRLKVNESYSVRHVDDKFGRKFTELRRGITDDDKKPFATL